MRSLEGTTSLEAARLDPHFLGLVSLPYSRPEALSELPHQPSGSAADSQLPLQPGAESTRPLEVSEMGQSVSNASDVCVCVCAHSC